jgi:ribosomal protein S16
MSNCLKLKKIGHKKTAIFELIILKKKTGVYTSVKDKIGNIFFEKKAQESVVYLNKAKVLYWNSLGLKINKKIKKYIV